MTKAAQKDMFPDTITYPVKAVPRPSKKIAEPVSQMRNFVELTIRVADTALEKWIMVAITTKLAPNMCNRRTSQTKFPWNTTESSSTN